MSSEHYVYSELTVRVVSGTLDARVQGIGLSCVKVAIVVMV
jgi:hypothetical protein